jgi:hypothetical protein
MAEPAAAEYVLQACLVHNAIGIPRERPGDVVERGETLGLLREVVKSGSQLHYLAGTRGQALQPAGRLRTLAARLGEELRSLVDASNCLGQAASDTA